MRLNYPEILPITSHRGEIVKAIEENQVVLVVGETGSGKSTQIPKMIIEALANLEKTDPAIGGFKIACTQPRRIAAVSIASWIAHEMEVNPGEEVGYKIRFDDETSAGTIVTICTDGILLQEMKGDKLLSRYDAILVDEAHERNLNIDFLIGLINDIQVKRREAGLKGLKILVTSATFDAEKFATFFRPLNTGSTGEAKDVPVINVSGRLYPVDIRYDPLGAEEDGFKKIAVLVREIYRGSARGDMLIFLPGEAEISHTIREIELMGERGIRCLPLYSRLSMDDQELVYNDYPNQMKVVVATNIAETSLTVPGIRYVIDSGVSRMTDFNFRTGIGSLEIQPVSQASAIQRAGRAGRVQPGICIRFYSKKDFETREKYTKPEIQRSDLSSVVLHMLLIGIKDLTGFKFIDAPEPKAFRNAIANLIELGAIDEQQNLTQLGIKMAHLPLEPRISAMLLAAEKYNCVSEVAIIASSLSVKDPFLRPSGEEEDADHAKRNFQRLAMSGGPRYRTLRYRRGRRVITKRVVDKNFAQSQLASDLMVFLVVWNRLQAIQSEEQRELFCQSNYLNYLIFREIGQIYKQLLDTLNIFAKDEFSKYLLKEGQNDLSVDLSKKEGILKSISSGFIQNLCELSGQQSYRMRSTENVMIHPGSALFNLNPHYFVSAEIVETTRLFARNNTVIDPRWLEEIAPQLCRVRRGPIWFDRKRGTAVCEEEVLFRGVRIVKERVREVAATDKKAAQDYLIREGLVKKQLIDLFPWLQENEKVVAKLKVYAAKLAQEQWVFTPARLREWYENRLGAGGKWVVSVEDLTVLLREKGPDYLKIELDEVLSPAERQRIDAVFPEELYLAGKKYAVEYHYDDNRFPSGPVIILPVEDLIGLDDEVVRANLKNFQRLEPYFVVSEGGPGEAIAEGKSIREIKTEVDRWHLRRNLKKLKHRLEVRAIRFDEVWPHIDNLLDQETVGASLFQKTLAATVDVYIGLRLEGKKIVKTVFEEQEVAWLATLAVFRALFQWQNRYGLSFKESQIRELEQAGAELLYGIDLLQVLEEALWKKIALEVKLKNFAIIRNVEEIKKIFLTEKDNLTGYKEAILADLKKLIERMGRLAVSEKSEDLQELSLLKQKIGRAEF